MDGIEAGDAIVVPTNLDYEAQAKSGERDHQCGIPSLTSIAAVPKYYEAIAGAVFTEMKKSSLAINQSVVLRL